VIAGRTAAEEGNATKVARHRRNRAERSAASLERQLNEIGIRTELESVPTTGDGERCRRTGSGARCDQRRVGFTAKIAEARMFTADVGAARKIGEAGNEYRGGSTESETR